MLDSKTAQAHLKDAATLQPLSVQIERTQNLPPLLRTIAFTLLGCDQEGKPFTSLRTSSRRVAAQAEAALLCDTLSLNEREQLFNAFFPKFGGVLARWWSPEISPLHQIGWNPRPFRLLQNTVINRPSRLQQLQSLLSDSPYFGIGRYCEQDLTWFATYAPYLGSEASRTLIGDRIGAILATALDQSESAEASTLQEILRLSVQGKPPAGSVGRHAIRALLSSSHPENWQYLLTLLAENGERETVRRPILEVAGEAHPDAFRKILTVLREKNLLRFPDVVNTVIGWLGIEEEGFGLTEGNGKLAQIESFLADSDVREHAISQSTEGATVYFALWSAAFYNVRTAIGLANQLLSDPSVERRFAAAYLLAQARLKEAEKCLINALSDADLRVAAFAFSMLDWNQESGETPGEASAPLPSLTAVSEKERQEQEREKQLLLALQEYTDTIVPGKQGSKSASSGGSSPLLSSLPDTFDQVAQNLPRFPVKERLLEPIIWGWTRRPVSQSALADRLPLLLKDRSPVRLQPLLPQMSPQGRLQVIEVLSAKQPRTTEGASLLITLLSDSAANIRQHAAEVLKRFPLEETQVDWLESMFANKISSDMQAFIQEILLARADDAVLGTVERLLASPLEPLRISGLTMLAQLADQRRMPDSVRVIVDGWLDSREAPTITDSEIVLLKRLLPPRRVATLNANRF